MILFPAIDIQDGKVVRLVQGQFDQVTEYAQDPVTVARQWEEKGATWLHVVDLDGARTGVMQNQETILNIVDALNIPVQTGGGIRSHEDVNYLLNGGVARVILGTKVVEELSFLKDVLKKWGDRIAVSLDCHNGMVAQKGWTQTSELKATEFVKVLESMGLKILIYTDIARDGMLTGPNLEALKELLTVTNIPVIASGGIATMQHIEQLVALENEGVMGAISGKALYEGTLDLKEALNLC